MRPDKQIMTLIYKPISKGSHPSDSSPPASLSNSRLILCALPRPFHSLKRPLR